MDDKPKIDYVSISQIRTKNYHDFTMKLMSILIITTSKY